MAHKYDQIKSLSSFKALEANEQKKALSRWKKYHSPQVIAETMGISVATYYYYCTKLGLSGGKRANSKQRNRTKKDKSSKDEPIAVRKDPKKVFTFGGHMDGSELAYKLEAIGLMMLGDSKRYAVQISMLEVDDSGFAELIPDPALDKSQSEKNDSAVEQGEDSNQGNQAVSGL